MIMKTRDDLFQALPAVLAWVMLLAAPVAWAAPDPEGGAMIKKITGDQEVQINGRKSSLRSGQQLSLPANLVTGASRVMLRLPGRLVAIGRNSSCTILPSGEIEIEDGIGGAVAVQPDSGVVQEIFYLSSGGELREGARAWSAGTGEELDEGAGELAKIASSRARARVRSLAFAFGPAVERGGYFKVMLFEGHADVVIDGEPPVELISGNMSQVKVEKGGGIDDEVHCDTFNLEIAVETSALIKDFEEYWDLEPVKGEIARQKAEIRDGEFLSFRRDRARRGSSTAVEDRQIIRGLRKGRTGGGH